METSGGGGDVDSPRRRIADGRKRPSPIRYHNHDQAQTFATKQLEATERRMVELQESTHGSWIDVQFLKAANEMVIDCRRVLKYTYVYGYYLDPNHKKARPRRRN